MNVEDKLVVGCGYLGSRVAARWRDAGHKTWVVTRSSARAREFSSAGFFPLVADVASAATLVDWPRFDSVLFAVGFDRTAGHTIEAVYAGGVAKVLAALRQPPTCFTYISSTGVYGDAAGAELNEDSPCEPRRPGGIASLAAERAVAASACGTRSIVLRLAGIYGPGRVPNRELLVQGEKIAAAPQSWLNLIHVDDAVAAVLAAERYASERPERLPATFIVSDGSPARREDYYQEVARLVGAPAPKFVEPTDRGDRRAGADKRVSNARMLSELGITPRYPSFREGLRAIFSENS